MSEKIWGFIERYLTRKIGAEIKCCVMFFMIICFYSGYKLICGTQDANIIHMIQMVLIAYVLCWIQALVGSDFDEVDRLKIKDWSIVIGGSAIYTAVSLMLGWFDSDAAVTVIFFAFMIVSYLGIFLIYKIKRAIDAKLLNDDLKQFQLKNKDN